MTRVSKYPCEECICLAICKGKVYDDLVKDCEIIRVMLYYEDSGTRTRAFAKNAVEIKKALDAQLWYASVDNDGYARIWDKRISTKPLIIGYVYNDTERVPM